MLDQNGDLIHPHHPHHLEPDALDDHHPHQVHPFDDPQVLDQSQLEPQLHPHPDHPFDHDPALFLSTSQKSFWMLFIPLDTSIDAIVSNHWVSHQVDHGTRLSGMYEEVFKYDTVYTHGARSRNS